MGSYDSVDWSNLVLLKFEYFMLQNKEISDSMLYFFPIYRSWFYDSCFERSKHQRVYYKGSFLLPQRTENRIHS